MGSKIVTLKVNEIEVPLSFFVQTYFDHILDGIARSLEGACQVKTMTVDAKDKKVSLIINGETVRLNEFVERIVFNTAHGMVSSLRGVTSTESFVIAVGHGQ